MGSKEILDINKTNQMRDLHEKIKMISITSKQCNRNWSE